MVKSLTMGTWAIVKISGKQYKVAEGDTIAVDKIIGKSGSISIDDVLLIKNEKSLAIGKPLVEKAKVKAKILGDFKDKKIRVVKFRPKSRYTRTRGHRQQKTKVLIEKIEN